MIAIKHKDAGVRFAAAKHPNATLEIIKIAIKDKDEDVRWSAARNPNATPEILDIAIKDKDKDVRKAAEDRIKSDPILALQYAAYKAEKTSVSPFLNCSYDKKTRF